MQWATGNKEKSNHQQLIIEETVSKCWEKAENVQLRLKRRYRDSVWFLNGLQHLKHSKAEKEHSFAVVAKKNVALK